MPKFEDGQITYQVELETKNLLEESKKVREELKELNNSGSKASKGLEQLETSAKNTSNSLGKLTSVAKAVSAALVSSTVLSYAQSWNELEDRIQNTGATASQTKDILDQLLATSDRNGRTIEESSELYIRLSNSMGELGYSTQSTLSYIDTLSNLLTINKTSSVGAESAMNALTKAQMKGKLAGLEAMSVFNAMPSILKTLGKQLNKTETEVRKMATDGKLSMSQFTEAMIAAQEETAALADNMRNTVQDGINRVTNNLKKYFGELNNSTGATKTLVDALILMSQHVDILMTGVGALAAVYAGKYITSLASATQKSAEKTITDIKLALAEKQAAQAALQQAQAEAKIAREAKQAITAQLQLNQTVRTTKALKQQLTLADAQLEKATNAETAAQARLNTAMKATNFAAKGLQATMAMLGGPAGMLLLAAGALTTWASKAEEAKQKALGFADAIDDVNESLKDLTVNQLNTQIDEVEDDLDLVEKQAEKTASKLRYLQTLAYNSFNRLDTEYDTPQGLIKLNREIRDLKSELDKLSQSKDKLNAKLQRYKAAVEVVTNKTNDSSKKVKSLDDALKSVGENKIDEKIKSLSTQIEIADMKLKDSKRAAYIYENVLNDLGAAGEEYKATLKDLILDSTKWATVSEDVRKVLEPLFKAYGDLFDKNEQLSASNKKGRSTTKSYADETKKLNDELKLLQQSYGSSSAEAQIFRLEQETNTKIIGKEREKLEELFNLLDGYKTIGEIKNPLKFEEDSFNNAKTALNDWFTKNPDKYSDYYSKLEQLEKQHQINLAKIQSDAVVSDIDNAVAQVDPVLALESEHKRKLALIQEFETQKWTSEQNAIALREAANRQFEQNRINAQWEIWRNQSDANEFLAASLEGLASSATSTISGLMSGTMTATQAMQNFANVILNEAIGSLVQMGMQYVKNAIVAQSASATTTAAQITEAIALAEAYQPAAMNASIATQGAAATIGAESYIAALGSMRTAAIAGGRLRGGGVDVGKAYRVNESGQAEMFVAQGKQYMIPNKNGEIIPSNKLSNGGSRTIVNNITQNISFGDGQNNADAANETARTLKQAIKAVIQDEQRPGGLLNRR